MERLSKTKFKNTCSQSSVHNESRSRNVSPAAVDSGMAGSASGERQIRVNLVFSPFARPFVPLGIAQIKSYVEKNSNFSVKCFDLNAIYHNAIADAIRNNDPNVKFPSHDRPVFLKTIDVLKSNNQDFFNQAVYNKAAASFIVYFDAFKELFHKICENALHKNGKPPWFVNEYVDLLLSDRPDVVGFSVMFREQFYVSALIARLLKKADKNIKIVFGGNTASSVHQEILPNEFIDFVVLNEGERSFLDLLRSFNNEKGPGEVPNLVFEKKAEVVASETFIINKLDDLPFPDFSDFDLNSYFTSEPVLPTLGSRGCFWRRCTFCVHHKSYFNKYRTASINRVVDELEYHVKNGITFFNFVDEMISASRFKQIGEEILRRGLKLHYYALAKPTADFTKDVLGIMHQSGCRYIIWGVESGCQRILDLIDKGTKVQDISRVLADSTQTGIKNHVYIIIGFPSETKQELKKTLDFLYENKDNIHTIHKSSFTLHKGSMIYDDPERFCITRIFPAGTSIDSLKYVVSKGLTKKEAKEYRIFYGKNYFDYFSYFSIYLGLLRDHALLLYSNPDKLIFNMQKKTVPLPNEVWPPSQEKQFVEHTTLY